MRLMAIDYGGKRVGVASTDESGKFALPRVVLPNKNLLQEVLKLAREWGIERIIVGESKNFKNEDNPIQKDINKFVSELKKAGLDVVLHAELMTSQEAARLQGENDMIDASAAAIILKSYIDTYDNN